MKSDAPLQAPPTWRRLALISDLHVGAHAPGVPTRLLAWLAGSALRADALFILGDLFEAWVGDDQVDADPDSPEARICDALARFTASGRFLGVLHGNRDFLLGEAFARRTGARLLPDPCVLEWAGRRLLLSHGDALCTDDTAYQQWRTLCRNPAWQAGFVALPLAERLRQAQAARDASRQAQDRMNSLADVDPSAAAAALRAAGSVWLIHGHTHRPRDHWDAGLLRQVLPDWDAQGAARAEVLWLSAGARWIDVRRAAAT